jgi:hypothetical protein
MERMIYRLLSLFNWYKAARRGPGALVRRYERIQGYRAVNRAFRAPRRKRR